jgi:hypothetical protein
MGGVTLTVKQLRSKVEKLIHLHKNAESENSKIKQLNDELIKKTEKQQNTIKELEERNKILKLAKKISETDESALETKSKINELVKEIDRCIALLNE